MIAVCTPGWLNVNRSANSGHPTDDASDAGLQPALLAPATPQIRGP